MFDSDAACPPLPPPTRTYPRVPSGTVPRFLFSKAPASDAELSAGLIAHDIRAVRFPQRSFSELPDGAIAVLVNDANSLFITPDGGFAEAAPVQSNTIPIVPAGGDWLLRRGSGDDILGFVNYHDDALAWSFSIDGTPPSVGGRAGSALPALQSGGRAVFAAGLDAVAQACASTRTPRWVVRYDASRFDARDWTPYYDVFAEADDSVLFVNGSPELYRFSADGDLIARRVGTEAQPGWTERNAIAYSPTCGLFVRATNRATGGQYWIERWSSDLERLWQWEPPVEDGLSVALLDDMSVTTDCGVLTLYRFDPRSSPAIQGRLKVSADGHEAWRQPFLSAGQDVSPKLPAFALRDGGFMVVGTANDGSGTALLHFADDGSLISRFVVTAASEPGDFMPATPVLTPDGVLYYGADRSAGSAWAIVAVATGLVPAAYGWAGSGGNAFRTNGVTW